MLDLKLLNLALNLYKRGIILFESRRIRSQWNETDQKWYFSIVDVIDVLTESPRPRKYWNALKTKLRDEGSELSQFLGQLKMAN